MELVDATDVVERNGVAVVIRLVHRHGGHHAGNEADELRRQLIRRGPGLARGRQARNGAIDVAGRPVAAGHRLECRHDRGDLLHVEHALGRHVPAVQKLAARVLHLLHDVRIHALSAVGNRRIRGRQVDVVRRGRPQDVEKLVVQAQGVLGNTGINGSLEGPLRTHIQVQRDVRRVHRVLGGTHERHVPKRVAAVVGDRHAHAREVLRRLTRVRVVDRSIQASVGQQRKGLERRSGHRDVLSDGVLLARQVVGARVLRKDLAGGRIQGRQGDVLVGRIPSAHLVHALGGGDGLLLVLLDDRGGDAQATLADLILIELAGLDQLRPYLGHQVAVRAGHGFPVEGLRVDRLGEHRRIRLGLRHPTVLHHQAQDPLPPLFRLLGADSGIPCRRRGDDARDHRGLRQGQVLRRMPEIRLGGRVDSIGAAPEVNGVHVGADDLVLGLLSVDLDRQDGFLELAAIRRGFTDVIALDILLGER